ncbi:MAG: ABC transporter ATP-binding protein [Firmicutes bacterium]|nr:ABC transporter ATP-binding protein [Bacillota bacterium]
MLVEVKQLYKYFYSRGRKGGLVKAVDGVSFNIDRGECFGLVGESGCGKSTLGRAVLRLTDVTAGEVYFQGINLLSLNSRELKRFRKKMQIIFQDPDSSLDPRFSVYKLLAEPLRVQGESKAKIGARVSELMEMVNLGKELLCRYPHELSGGQRQRIGIARAMALNPEFLVADEPAASLDLSVQAQILRLMKTLQKDYNLGILFISHQLKIIRIMTQRVAVMYLGKFVEVGRTNEIFSRPLHPYTKALLAAEPDPKREPKKRKLLLKGEVPDPSFLPTGCRFHPRCPYFEPQCAEVEPVLVDAGGGHWVACHRCSVDAFATGSCNDRMAEGVALS